MHAISEIASRACKVLLKVCDLTCYLILAIMAVVVTAEVASRYLLGHSLQIAEEVASLGLVAFIFLSLPGTFSEDGLLRIDALYGALTSRVRAWLGIVFSVCALAVTGVYVWQLILLVRDSYLRGSRSDMALGTPNYIPQSLMVTGAVILFLAILMGALGATGKDRSGLQDD